MTNKEIYDKLLEAAKNNIESWKKANKITPIEQVAQYQPVVSGIAIAALHLLPTDMYFMFTDEVRQAGGVI